MKRIGAALALTLILSLVAAPAVLAVGQSAAKSAARGPAHHPWVGFNLGSWVKIRTTSVNGKQTSVMDTKITLLEKTAEKVVLQTDLIVNGQTTTTKADFPVKDFSEDVPEGVTVVNRGSETITIAGRSLKCETLEVSMDLGGGKTVTKTWSSTQVPGAVVKMVISGGGGQSTVELVDFKSI